MLSISSDKIDSLFESIAKEKTLFLPVDNTSGKANFEKWEKGKKLSGNLKTVRSAKDFFFPKTEKLVGYKVDNGNITVEDPRKELNDFVIFGVRACDAKSFEIFDKVYLEMSPVDSYFKNRRDHAIIITLACNEPEKTCFCTAYDLDPANPTGGDVKAWLADGSYYFEAESDKGKAFLDSVKSSLADKDSKAVDAEKKSITDKIEKQPFAHIDLEKFKKVPMMDLFNSSVWAKMSETCLGCGTCTYVCPSCMCFDVRDFDNGKGVEQVRCWDSCMYSDFTQMAAANPRLTQTERFRQRFMHKLVYYPMAHENLFMCVGCGRCLESCPINMNIVKVIKAFNESEEGK